MKKLPDLSIFFPFWNEEANVEQVVQKAKEVANSVALDWEMILIDDGSSDKTLSICEKLALAEPRIRIVSHFPNRGYGGALKEGFKNAKFSYIVFTDGDSQFDFSQVGRFIDNIEDADMVIGYRKKRQDAFVRYVLMNLLKVWDFVFFGFYFRDIDCGFKMFRRKSLEKLMPLRSEGAMITTELLAKARIKKLKIKEVEVSHYPRRHGLQSGGNIYVVIRAVLESLILWWDLKNGRY